LPGQILEGSPFFGAVNQVWGNSTVVAHYGSTVGVGPSMTTVPVYTLSANYSLVGAAPGAAVGQSVNRTTGVVTGGIATTWVATDAADNGIVSDLPTGTFVGIAA